MGLECVECVECPEGVDRAVDVTVFGEFFEVGDGFFVRFGFGEEALGGIADGAIWVGEVGDESGG